MRRTDAALLSRVQVLTPDPAGVRETRRSRVRGILEVDASSAQHLILPRVAVCTDGNAKVRGKLENRRRRVQGWPSPQRAAAARGQRLLPRRGTQADPQSPEQRA